MVPKIFIQLYQAIKTCKIHKRNVAMTGMRKTRLSKENEKHFIVPYWYSWIGEGPIMKPL